MVQKYLVFGPVIVAVVFLGQVVCSTDAITSSVTPVAASTDNIALILVKLDTLLQRMEKYDKKLDKHTRDIKDYINRENAKLNEKIEKVHDNLMFKIECIDKKFKYTSLYTEDRADAFEGIMNDISRNVDLTATTIPQQTSVLEETIKKEFKEIDKMISLDRNNLVINDIKLKIDKIEQELTNLSVHFKGSNVTETAVSNDAIDEIGAVLCAASAAHEAEPVGSKENEEPAQDTLDHLMRNATGCKYRTVAPGEKPVLYSAVWQPGSGAAEAESTLNFLLAGRTGFDLGLYLYWNDTYRYHIRLFTDQMIVWNDKKYPESVVLSVPVEGAMSSRRYLPVHIAVQADRVMLTLACDSNNQYTINTTTAALDRVQVRVYCYYKFWTKVLYDCPLRYSPGQL